MRLQAGPFLLLWPMLVAAAPYAGERAALAERRQAVEQGFQAAQAECATRFAVSSCIDAARLKRRDELVALQKAEAALAARERREATRRSTTERAAAVPAASSAAAAPALQRMPAPEPAASAASAANASVDLVPPPRAGQTDRAADERRARVIYERRQQQVESRRRKVEQRNAERPSKAAPLPVPASGVSR